MNIRITPFVACILLGLLSSSFAEVTQESRYSGELNGIPCKVRLWWSGDDVIGFLDRVDGKPMTLRLAGENRTAGKMTLKAMQAYGDVALLKLSRRKEGGVTVWSGVAQFKDGTSLSLTFKKS